MRNPHGFDKGKPFRYELPKPIPVTQRFDFHESLTAVKPRTGLLILAVVMIALYITEIYYK